MSSAPTDATLLSRVAHAFSLRENLRRLFIPTREDGHLRPLDGLRAFSILWVVAFHAGWYAVFFVPPGTWLRLLEAPAMLPVWRGDFGVDLFFVLSGFLIGRMLLRERERTGRIAFGLFYVRRLFRLWPALLVCLCIDQLTIGDHRDAAWANVFYVSNFVPILGAAMGWTWSLAIEEQFYLVGPWLIRAIYPMPPGARLRTMAIACGVLVVVTGCVAVQADLHPWDAEIVLNRDPLRWALGFDVLYDKPWTRANALLVGVAAAILHGTPGVLPAIGRARGATTLGMCAAIIAMAAATHWPIAMGNPTLEIAYLACFRTVFASGAAFLLLASLSDHPIGAGLGRVLSARVLYPFSQLAYSAYLLNPIVSQFVLATQRARFAAGQNPMSFLLPVDVALTFFMAAILHLFIERPFMELRPRAPQGKAISDELAQLPD